MNISQFFSLIEEPDARIAFRWTNPPLVDYRAVKDIVIANSLGEVSVLKLAELVAVGIDQLAQIIDRFIGLVFHSEDNITPHPHDVAAAVYLFLIRHLSADTGVQMAQLVSGMRFASAYNLNVCGQAIRRSGELAQKVARFAGGANDVFGNPLSGVSVMRTGDRLSAVVTSYYQPGVSFTTNVPPIVTDPPKPEAFAVGDVVQNVNELMVTNDLPPNTQGHVEEVLPGDEDDEDEYFVNFGNLGNLGYGYVTRAQIERYRPERDPR